MKKLFMILGIIIIMTSTVAYASFDDIKGLGCENAVNQLEYLKIINGVGLNQYAPNKDVTRAELSKMMTEVLKLSSNGEKTFSDISNHWGKAYIETAASHGILKGYEDGTFQPNQSVTYAEAVAIMLRGMEYSIVEVNSANWYQGYWNKAEEIGLSRGVETWKAELPASRGDIAVLLWNTICSEANGTSILTKNFPEFQYIENEVVKNIITENQKIVYITSHHRFYVEEGIDFAHLGGKLSGFLDGKTNTFKILEVDSDVPLKKIAGDAKKIKALGYDVFNCSNIVGYGDKNHAQYVEVFVNEDTERVERVVFYDTSESYFAEKIKIGTNKISIDSKDVYDESIIVDNGKTIKLKILRTETVKDIPIHALLIHEGRVVDWTSVPNNSMIREIKANEVYTYYHQTLEVELTEKAIGGNGIKIEKTVYPFAEKCIMENIHTKTATKWGEDGTYDSLRTIVKNDKALTLYLNELGEIVKIEYVYDVWKDQEQKDKTEMMDKIQSELKDIGIVDEAKLKMNESGEDTKYVRVVSYPPREYERYSKEKTDIEIGDFVYNRSGDRLIKITKETTWKHLKIVPNYQQPIYENRFGLYTLTDTIDYIEVILTKGNSSTSEPYRKCTLTQIDRETFTHFDGYQTVHLILNEDDEIVRIYALREVGNNYNYGIIRTITQKYSGDLIVSHSVSVLTEAGQIKKYGIDTTDRIGMGDLVSYETQKNTNTSKSGEKIEIIESYRSGVIGSKYDYVVKNQFKGSVYFQNSDEVLEINQDNFILNGKQHLWEDYVILYAKVSKDKTTGDYIFTSFERTTKGKINALKNDRVAIDELSKTIVFYRGYSES